jgi:hypothetical protein
VPVVTRRRSVRLLLVIAAGFPLLLAGGAAVLTVVIGQSCTGSGVGDAPSPVAVRDIPPGMLAIYSGSTPRTSCRGRSWPGSARRSATPASSRTRRARRSPGEGPRGTANFAGASGPMQVGIGGAAGDEYDALRHLLPDPSLGPHDPTTAVELAALMLTRDKGAPTGQPIDALPRLRACVNGAGPMAEAYAARVLADAHAYLGAGSTSLGALCSSVFGTPSVPGTKARILTDGVAAAPPTRPRRCRR